jgi:beta-lactamase class A
VTTARLLAVQRDRLAAAGLVAGVHVRDLETGAHLGLDDERQFPSASLVKVPIAVAVLERIADGRLSGAEPVDVEPGRVTTPGPTGLTRFRHPARVAVDDLLYLSVALSDNTATDALLRLVSLDDVADSLRRTGIGGITVRHALSDLHENPADRLADGHLAQSLAVGGRTSGHGHPVAQLDVSRASSGSARAYAGLLQELWRPTRMSPAVAERVRTLLGATVHRQRLAPDFASDASTWSSKTGTLLNLRHEIGVVEHDDGGALAIAVLTSSSVPAATQPAAEATMAQVARALHDHLRTG